MKCLRFFLKFLFELFAQGKVFTVTGISDWVDYDTKQILGTKVEVTITEDNTAYPPGKNGQPISNLYEKMYWKVPKKVTFPIGTIVVPVNAEATVYGEYQNQLSVRVGDIKVAPASASVPVHTPTPTHSPTSAGAGKSLS